MRYNVIKKESEQTHSQSPFFGKEQASNFFAHTDKPFFTSHPIQAKLAGNQPNEKLQKKEGENENLKDSIQKLPLADSSAPPAPNNQPPPNSTTTPSATSDKNLNNMQGPKSATEFIVEDTAVDLLPGQMKKTPFLSQLKGSVCNMAEIPLKAAGRTTDGCPYIEQWFGYYAGKTAMHVEQALRKFSGVSKVTKAEEYIGAVSAKVQMSVAIWVLTGKISGLPQGISPGENNTAPQESENASQGPMFLQTNNVSAANNSMSAAAVKSSLGNGRPLESGTKNRMEGVFGRSFSQVRIHDSEKASELTNKHNARAFTLGSNIAFGNSEYQPGTPMGDAIIAHELAHVVQQQNAEGNQSALKGISHGKSLEDDADRSTKSAMLSLWANAKGGTSKLAKEALPRLRSGVQIQSCGKTVKRCPKGKKWGVVATAGAGPVCICRWKCVYDDSPSTSSGYSNGPQLHCNPRPCPKTEYEDMGDDYGFEVEGQKKEPEPGGETGIGGHMSPLTAPAMCGCLPLTIEGGEETEAPLKYVDIDLTDIAGMKGRSTRTGQRQPDPEVPKGPKPVTGKQPAPITTGKGDVPVPKTPPEAQKPKGPDYSQMPLSKLRKLAPGSPEAANALLDRYRNWGLGNLKKQYGTDATAKALLDEYYQKPTPTLQKLEEAGDKLAKQVLDDVYGEKNAAGRRPLLELRPSDQAKTDELKDSLKGERAASGIERRDLRRELKRGQLQGGTMGVGDSDIPGLEGTQAVGKSPRAGGKPDPTFEPPSTDVRAKGHAEQNLAGQFDAKIQQALDSKKLTREQLNGKTVRFHIEEEVCSVCRQGLNPGAKTLPGTLKKFSQKYPELTIEITAVGTSEVIRIRNGEIVDK